MISPEWQSGCVLFQYGVMSDVSCVNCPTLDQTYWFLSVGTWIFWALCFGGRMITFSSSHWYFIMIVLLLLSVQTTTANCPSEKQLYYGCLSFPSYETVHVPGLLQNTEMLDSYFRQFHLFTWIRSCALCCCCFRASVHHPLAMQWHFLSVLHLLCLQMCLLPQEPHLLSIMLMFVTPSLLKR